MASSIKPKFDIKDPPCAEILRRYNLWQTANSSKCRPNSKRPRLVVGLDIELVNPRPSPATIQLCIHGRCLIYRMRSTSPLPRALEKFLTDPNNIFVGVHLEYKLSVLKHKTNLTGIVPYANLCHLVASHCNRPELLDAEIRELASIVLGKELMMPKVNPDSGQPELSDEQVIYACIGAYVSYQMGTVIV
ncbi:hypothetical protein ACS0TY_024736 [Phlomoides rotata]